jgi:hypothetical protein
MTEQKEGTERTSGKQNKIRVAVRPEHLEDLKARGERYNFFSQTEEDVEAQGIKGWVAQTEDDVEGQGFKYVIAETEEDVEDQGTGAGWLEPVGPDEDVEAQGYVWIELERDEDDPTGQSYKYGG